ncbi:MAG: hypothetical protein JXR76_19500 [Deltaproteobacteria bacterium]|nr:hypothetical protein [Deltaproteobacteria bacterium]
MAFPSGLQGSAGPAWNIGPSCFDGNDIAFARAIVKNISSSASIDRSRVSAVGTPWVAGSPITFLGAIDTFTKWSQINQCITAAGPVQDENGCLKYTTDQCADDAEVVLCSKDGGGHEAGDASVAWPIFKTKKKCCDC